MYYNLINSMSRGGGGLDVNVQAFITANGITDTTYINALNTCVLGLKSDGLYSGIQGWWIFYGNANQSKYNFINTSSFQLAYFGTNTINNNGLILSGGGSYVDTFFTPIANQTLSSNGLTLISGTNNTIASPDAIEMGCIGGGNSFLAIKNNATYGGNTGASLNNTAVVSTNTDAKGIFTATKQSLTLTKIFKNGVSIASGSSGGTLSTQKIYIGACNLGGSPYSTTNQRIQQSIMHIGFSDAQVTMLHARLDTFETALGRKTW